MRYRGHSWGQVPKYWNGLQAGVEDEIFHHFVWLNAEHQGVFYTKVQASELIKRDQPLGELRDFSGNVLQRLISPVEGRILLLVTSPTTKKGNALMGIGTEEVYT